MTDEPGRMRASDDKLHRQTAGSNTSTITSAALLPTPGPWLLRGKADEGVPAVQVMLGVEPATEDRPGGWPYLIRQDREVLPGEGLLHLAIGIQRLADGLLMAAAPDLAAVLRRLLACPDLILDDLDPETREAAAQALVALERSGFP